MTVVSALLESKGWATSVSLVLTTAVVYILVNLLSKPALHPKAPVLFRGYPIVGSPMFFTARDVFYKLGTALSKTGNFSFYFGKIQIIGLSGESARKFYFETKALDPGRGYERLFATTPKIEVEAGDEDWFVWFHRNLRSLVQRDIFVKTLPTYSSDIREAFAELNNRKVKVTDPYQDLYRVVYQLTMRTVGCEEIANSKELVARTLALFENLETTSSPTRLILPWLPTPAHIRRMTTGARLYMMIDKFIKERKRTGTRYDDAMQRLMDQNANVTMIIAFMLGSLFAGQINSGINAAAMMVNLTQNGKWMASIRDEVDGVIDEYRVSENESRFEILGRLDLDAWESKFPLVDLALKETIRTEMVGAAFRYNENDSPLEIAGTGEVVPPGAYAIYHSDDVHMNPDIYTDPARWDPGRFLRGEDKNQAHGFIGWGTGRHPCPGMRFAKLEMNLIAAHFIALFDFQLSDKDGNAIPGPPPPKSRSKFSAAKPDVPVYLRYQLRDPCFKS